MEFCGFWEEKVWIFMSGYGLDRRKVEFLWLEVCRR